MVYLYLMIKNNPLKKEYLQLIRSLPNVGDLVEATVLEIGRNEVYLDIKGITTGIVRGPELYDESGEFSNLKKGSKVIATVIEEENERGLMELSFQQASHKKAWSRLEETARKEEIIPVKVLQANRGGLIIQYGKIQGFLPVSHLNPKHYPRVENADKNKILEKLKTFVGQELQVKIINVDKTNEQLIVSEKEAAAKEKASLFAKQEVGDIIEGKITGLVDFGAFVTFNKNQEGLVHISELAWQRIDHPADVVKVGDKVKAKIIGITDDGKISLSTRRLMSDPWKQVTKKYKIGQVVEGKVIKINPFGLFVELDNEIHGLAHISELSEGPVKNISDIARVGDKLKFKIVSIEPEDHRLGLSIKALENKKSPPKADPPLAENIKNKKHK